MRTIFLFFVISALASCTTSKYYVVRHAEKEPATAMASDVLLTDAGKQRANVLKDKLKDEHISHIYSTNYARTKATANPLSVLTGVKIETYDAADASFINQLKSLPKGNVLIVGHSNTVDDIVNGLTGKNELKDLSDAAYGDLFIIRKKGNTYKMKQKHFGE
jgi:broad specificity phosphatase PhoE